MNLDMNEKYTEVKPVETKNPAGLITGPGNYSTCKALSGEHQDKFVLVETRNLQTVAEKQFVLTDAILALVNNPETYIR